MYWCPDCPCELKELPDGFGCSDCGKIYPLKNGFCVFDDTALVNALDYGLDKLKLDIESEELLARLRRYLIPNLGRIEGTRILSVGCGSGSDIKELNCLGVEAYGMDFLYRTKDWTKRGFSKHRFFVSSAARIPFPIEYFDVVLCMGVIEHVSEARVLKREYAELDRERELFLKALFSMLKQGGSLIISSPNRNFPIDFQHNAYGVFKSLARFSIYVHSPFTHFLESYYSLSRHFRRIGKHKAESLPLVNFFGFNVLKLSPQLAIFKRLFEVYIRVLDNSPDSVRRSFVNPYIVLKIRKTGACDQ